MDFFQLIMLVMIFMFMMKIIITSKHLLSKTTNEKKDNTPNRSLADFIAPESSNKKISLVLFL